MAITLLAVLDPRAALTIVHGAHDTFAGHLLEHMSVVLVFAHGDVCWCDHLTASPS